MRYLVERAAPVDLSCLGTQGPRPIHWACRKGHTATVQVLIQVCASSYINAHQVDLIKYNPYRAIKKTCRIPVL